MVAWSATGIRTESFAEGSDFNMDWEAARETEEQAGGKLAEEYKLRTTAEPKRDASTCHRSLKDAL